MSLMASPIQTQNKTLMYTQINECDGKFHEDKGESSDFYISSKRSIYDSGPLDEIVSIKVHVTASVACNRTFTAKSHRG
jgi:hypothetical protein